MPRPGTNAEIKDDMTVESVIDSKKPETKVHVYIPLAETDDSSVDVDQVDRVTINGKVYQVQRGVHVDVPVPVFMQLRNKYPNL